jgi:urea transport system permease protein
MSATQVRRVELLAVGAIAFLLIVVVPFLHAQGAISTFTLGVWGKYLCYALLAISVDLLWGFTGLLSSARRCSSPSAATCTACT